jgi:hypothetical protein
MFYSLSNVRGDFIDFLLIANNRFVDFRLSLPGRQRATGHLVRARLGELRSGRQSFRPKVLGELVQE